MHLPLYPVIMSGVILILIMAFPVSAASCGCSAQQVDRGPTIWDKGIQWASVTPDTSTLASTMAAANQSLSQYQALTGGKIGNNLAFKVSGTAVKKTGTKTAGLVPFNKTR